TGNAAVSGGGVYVDNSEFQLLAGSVKGNTATSGAVTRAHFENNTIAAASIAGGGGVYVYGEDSLFWLAEGLISGNTTKGSGGGVLVNGSLIPDNPVNTPHNFLMSAGTIGDNVSSGSVWPHGGGGVYVAKGVFEMIDGHITGNQSIRQGGGVFVWSRSLFYLDGNSSVTNNKGVGSSKAICSRGITTMSGKAQADKVYIWNYAKGSWNNGAGDQFTMTEDARVTGLELAFADDPKDYRNYVNLTSSSGSFNGTDLIATIGLESHLTSSGSFAKDATIDSDWLNRHLIKYANGTSNISATVNRFSISNYINGLATTNLTSYKLDSTGKLVKK
ncbi:MAG: hypothetical protein LBD44_02030, partial [Spirochaetaceae bacterium]|nr:hypothetical protein [Spirochaetaceae bacterium]